MLLARLAWIGLLLFQGNAPQDEKSCCRNNVPLPWPDYNKGVKWTMPNSEAVAKARNKNRLILYYHLVGDLDKGGC